MKKMTRAKAKDAKRCRVTRSLLCVFAPSREILLRINDESITLGALKYAIRAAAIQF